MAHLEFTVGDDQFTFELLGHAPELVHWLATAMPAQVELAHGIWSGEACVASIAASGTPPLESPISSIYPGYLLVVPDGRFETGTDGPAVVVGYGTAELRDAAGRAYGSPAARLIGPLSELRRCLASLRASGQARASMSIAE